MTTEVLLERSAECDAISRTVADAAHGSGTTLIVEGVAGAGKTSLLQAVRERAADASMRVLHAPASALECGFAFGVATQLFTAAVQREPDLLRGAAGFASHLFDPDAAPTEAGDDAAFLTMHGLHWLVEGLAESGPVALVIDDIHWADEPSLRFLGYLARRLEGVPVLVAVAARSGEPADPPRALTRLVEQAPARVLRPAPLSRHAVAELVAATLGPAEGVFVDACAEITGGNPFYLHACLAEAARRGMSPTKDDAGGMSALRPEAIASAVRARLDDLGEEHRALAEAVAVLGPGARIDDAAALAGLSPSEAALLADQLCGVGVLAGADRLAFAHAIVAASILEAIAPAERGERHRRAAHLLADRGAPDPVVAAQLVGARRGDGAWAREALRRATDDARLRGDPAQSVRLLRRALDERPPLDERAELLTELALTEASIGAEDAFAHLEEATELGGPPSDRARACLELGKLLTSRGAKTEALQALDRGLELVTPHDDPIAREIEMYKVWTLIIPSLAVPTEVAHRAFSLAAETAAEPNAERTDPGRRLLSHVAVRRALDGALDEAVRLAHRSIEGDGPDGSVEPAPSHRMRPDALAIEWHAANTGFAFVAAERPDLADTLLVKAEKASRGSEFASLIEHGMLHCARAVARDRLGDLLGAAADAEEAIAAAEHGWRLGLDLSLGVAAKTALERGHPAEAQRILNSLDDPAAWAQELTHADYLLARAELALSTGRKEAALEYAETATELCDRLEVANPIFPARSTAARALVAMGRTEEAAVLATEELAMAERAGNHRVSAITGRALALAIEDPGMRLELLRRSAAKAKASPARLEQARCLVELGAALRRARRRRDAREPLREGLDLARDCGSVVLASRAEAELEASGARVPDRPAYGVDALTPSELRVAELASAGGLSNRQIAERLFVTRRTVETHLTSVYRKLDVAGRDALAEALGKGFAGGSEAVATAPKGRRS